MKKNAGIIEPPPLMVKACVRLVTGSLAQEELNRTQKLLVLLREVYERISEFVVDLERTYSVITSGSFTDEEWESFKDALRFSLKKLNYVSAEKYRANPSLYRDLLESDVANARKAYQTSLKREREDIRSNQEKVRRLLKLDPLKGKKFRVPFNSRGWRYREMFLGTPVSEEWKFITLEIGFLFNASGFWAPEKRLLTITSGLDVLKDQDAIHEIVYHELQHVAQQVLYEVKKGKYDLEDSSPRPGVPGKKVLTPQWKQRVMPELGNVTLEEVHHLDDVEFFTDLKSAIHSMEHLLRRVSKSERGTLVKYMTGQKLTDEERQKVPENFTVLSFFKALKAHSPAKYKLALKEVYKEMLRF